MRLFYFTRSGMKFNPILDNPIFDAIADIFLPKNKLTESPLPTARRKYSGSTAVAREFLLAEKRGDE